MNRLDAYETFLRIVDTGSIRAAAERSHLASSVVSRRLRELEAHLETQLFKRSTRRMELTEAGKLLYERTIRWLDDLQETEQLINQTQSSVSGELRISAPLSFGVKHLSQSLLEFQTLHPDIRFSLDFNDRQVDLIQEGFDLAIRIGKLEDSALIARPLFPVKTALVASPDYLDAKGIPRNPSDLLDHHCLIYSNKSRPLVWNYNTPTGMPGEVSIKAFLCANNGEFLCNAAEQGMGIALLPRFLCHESLVKGSLVSLLNEYDWRSVHAYAIYPTTRHLSKRVRAFVDFLVERLPQTTNTFL